MEIDKLQSFHEIEEYLNSKKRIKHLLFGNGFSMAYNKGIFSYNALSTFIENTDDILLKKLFSSLNTKNFELIMQQLDNFHEMAKIFNIGQEITDQIKNTSDKLKNSLIEAVKTLHPEHVFTIPEEKSKLCFSFLEKFLDNNGYIFSTNYDLLPYWVLMRNKSPNAVDGFGRDREDEGDEFVSMEERSYSELRWGKYKREQTVYYLHGTLPVFDTGVEIIKEEYDNNNYLLENIKSRMEKKEYPIFVTAGNAREKLTHIMHNKYLSYCFDRFSSIEGSLITFGFNFGEYDTHIIEGINKAAHQGRKGGNKLHSVYIGVYSDENLEHINSIKAQFKCKTTLYNARTVNIWGN